MDDTERVVHRLFVKAAERVGSVARLADLLGVSPSEIRAYVSGDAAPSDAILLRTVELILDELPAIRSQVSPQAWQALSLPPG